MFLQPARKSEAGLLSSAKIRVARSSIDLVRPPENARAQSEKGNYPFLGPSMYEVHIAAS